MKATLESMWTPTYKAHLVISASKLPPCQQHRPILRPQNVPISWRDQPATSRQAGTKIIVSSSRPGKRPSNSAEKNQAPSVLKGPARIDVYSRSEFGWLNQYHYVGLIQCLVFRHGIPHNIPSDQGIHLPLKGGLIWACDRSYTGLFTYCTT